MPSLQLHLLGSPILEMNGEPLHFGLRKASALLIYLAVTRQAYNRDVLATLLWPEDSQKTARANLRRALYRINQELAPAEILTEGENLRLDPAMNLSLDCEDFRTQAAECLPEGQTAAELSQHRFHDSNALAEAVHRLEAAVRLYRGDFLSGFSLPDTPEFEEWVFYESDSLRQILNRLLALQTAAYQQNGDLPEAIKAARQWLAQDPLHEPAHRRLMALYAYAGQTSAALRQYEECARLLEANFDLQPEAQTQALYQAIQSRRFPLPEPANPAAPKLDRPAQQAASRQVPPIHYVGSGEVHIAYQMIGNGPLDVLLVGGFVSHLEQMWYEPGLADFFQQVSEHARLILFDKRGVGLSDRVGYPPTLDHTMEDILAVLQAADSRQAVIMGVSEGGPAAILFAASYPERVAGLILYGTMPRFTRAPDYPWALTSDQWEIWLDYLEENWGGPVSLETFAPSRASDPAFRQWWATLLRSASSPGGVRTVIDVARSIDVRPALPSITAPVLVLHRTDDRMIRVEGARYMAEALPNARLVEQPGEDHWWWVGDGDSLLAEIEHFLNNLQAPKLFPRVLATILALQPATESSQAEIEKLFNQEVHMLRGRILEPKQGIFLAAFDSASRALACAHGLRSITRTRRQPVRISLHTGECELSRGQIQGPAVAIAQEILPAAPIGAVMVSATVKDIVAGTRFDFTPTGQLGRQSAGQLALFTLD